MQQIIGPKSLLKMVINYVYFRINIYYNFNYNINYEQLFQS